MIQDIDLHRKLVVAVMNFSLPYKAHNFLSKWITVGLPRGNPLHNFRLVWVWNLVCHVEGQTYRMWKKFVPKVEEIENTFHLYRVCGAPSSIMISDFSTAFAITTLQLHPNSHISFVCSCLPFPGTNSTISTDPTVKRVILPQLIVICLRANRQNHPSSFPRGAYAMAGVTSQLLYLLGISYSLLPSNGASHRLRVNLTGTADELSLSCGTR
jgi:hypothetical protein